MKFTTIIFDLDGTIADTLPLCIAAFKKSIEPLLKRGIGEREIIETFGPSEEGTIRKLVPGYQEEAMSAYLNHYEALHYTCPAPFTGIRELLELIREKGAGLAMVTGKGVYSTRLSLKQFSLESYFGVVETGSPEGPAKVQGIKNVLRKLNARQDETLYIGDAPSDIKYSREAGIRIAAAAWADTSNIQELEALSPEWLFESVEEFTGWLAPKLFKR